MHAFKRFGVFIIVGCEQLKRNADLFEQLLSAWAAGGQIEDVGVRFGHGFSRGDTGDR